MLRDKIVVGIANFVLRFASKRYRNMLNGIIRYGLDSAVRDEIENRPPPPPDPWSGSRWL